MTTVSITVILSEPSPLLPEGLPTGKFDSLVLDMTKHLPCFGDTTTIPVVTDVIYLEGKKGSSKQVLLWYKIDGAGLSNRRLSAHLAANRIKTEMLGIMHNWNETQLGVRVELLNSAYS